MSDKRLYPAPWKPDTDIFDDFVNCRIPTKEEPFITFEAFQDYHGGGILIFETFKEVFNSWGFKANKHSSSLMRLKRVSDRHVVIASLLPNIEFSKKSVIFDWNEMTSGRLTKEHGSIIKEVVFEHVINALGEDEIYHIKLPVYFGLWEIDNEITYEETSLFQESIWENYNYLTDSPRPVEYPKLIVDWMFVNGDIERKLSRLLGRFPVEIGNKNSEILEKVLHKIATDPDFKPLILKKSK